MKVTELMRTDIATLHPDEPIETGWRSIRRQQLSGLPVTDTKAHVVGLLTEADLLARRLPPPARRSWHLGFLDARRLADHYRRAHGVTVGDVMTREIVAVAPEDSLTIAAVRMHEHHLPMLPVVAGDRVVGVVAASDLVGDLPGCSPSAPRATDRDLVAAMEQQMDEEAWTSSRFVRVEAADGVLTLSGTVESQAERQALRAMARAITGYPAADTYLFVRTERPVLRA